MFTAALFTLVKTWKQPKCTWTDQWIKKKWLICTLEYYSAIKKSAIMLLRFYVHNTVLLTVSVMLYSRSLELIHLASLKLYTS